MGVRILAGMADGTRQAAAMYDSVTGQMFGPIFEAEDAPEQIEAFLEWLAEMRAFAAIDRGELAVEPEDLPLMTEGRDAREWPASGLAKVVAFWRERYVDEDGLLREVEAA